MSALSLSQIHHYLSTMMLNSLQIKNFLKHPALGVQLKYTQQQQQQRRIFSSTKEKQEIKYQK